MSTRGKPLAVWLGAAGAFLLHVVIATTIVMKKTRPKYSKAMPAAMARIVMPACTGVWAGGEGAEVGVGISVDIGNLKSSSMMK